MENEIWKDIPEYVGYYQVSDLGRVRSLDRKVIHGKGGFRISKGKILIQNLDKRKYYYVGLSKKGCIKKFQIHQLVAIVFLEHTPCGMKLIIDHKNNNKLDNRLKNLQIITQRENKHKSLINNSSQYPGVCWHKASKKWQAKIFIKPKCKYLGLYINEEDARDAYLKELSKMTN